MKTYDVLYAGNYTKDTIITPDGSKTVDGGGMNYAAHAGKGVGIKAAVVTRLAKSDAHVVGAITDDGIDCFPIYSPQSTVMTLVYTTGDVDKREIMIKSTGGTLKADHVDGLTAKAVAVSPSLRGEVEPEFFEVLRKREGTLLAVDVQGFVRVLHNESLVYEPWPDMERVLANIDILKSDAVEAEFLTGESGIEKAARVFADLGAKEIVLTHSEGVLIHASGEIHHFKFHSQSLIGRSGRGDTCMGSYVAKRLSLPPQEAGKWAAAVTSMKMEKPGPFDRSISDVEAFIHRHYNDTAG